jgi:hypothetical protein
MKVLLDIPDQKASFFLELLKNFKFVKAKPLTPSYAIVLEELKEAVENMKLVAEGKLQPRPAEDLLNEL